MVVSLNSANTIIKPEHAKERLGRFFAENDYTGKRIIIIIPDNTRSGPVGLIFQFIYEQLAPKAKVMDCLVALGTHQYLSEEQICRRLDMTLDQRKAKYSSVRFFNHEWQNPETFRSIGTIVAEEISQLSEGLFSEDVNVGINKLIFDYDEIFILGPVFPHEVVGFSGGHKYIFPGIAGPDIINFFHWLGAVFTNPEINGHKWTPPRKVVERAASLLHLPITLFAIISLQNQLNGLFIGDCVNAWEEAADLSAQLHIVYKDRPYKTVLGVAPEMYEDMWTAAKVMYKLESVVADGGTLIIYAPYIDELSYTHGKYLDKVGYHTRDYFLKQMDKFKNIPRAVLAHSTHLRGIGSYDKGIEKPRINVVLATKISKKRCEKVNLGYLKPERINFSDYENKEDKGILFVPNAGETLYRLERSK